MTNSTRSNPALSRALNHDDIMRLIREADQSGFVRGTPVPPRSADDTPAFRPRDFASAPVEDLHSPEPDHTAPPGTQNNREFPSEIARPAPAAAPPAPDLKAIRQEAWAEGYAAGTAEAEAKAALSMPGPDVLQEVREEGYLQAANELADARDAFLAAAAKLSRPDAAAISTMRDQITEAVRKLASDRAGQAIDTMPQRFLNRIEGMMDAISGGISDVTIRLHPTDFDAVSPHLAKSPMIQNSRLTPDPDLRRGDVGLTTPTVSITDTLTRQRTKA